MLNSDSLRLLSGWAPTIPFAGRGLGRKLRGIVRLQHTWFSAALSIPPLNCRSASFGCCSRASQNIRSERHLAPDQLGQAV